MLSNILDRISFWSLFAVVVLLPIFFLPFTQIPVETSKGLLLVIGLAVSFIFWIAARFSDGKITIPKSWLLLSAFGIVFISLLSALFSSNAQVSLFGTMLDVGTFYFLLGGFLLMFLSSIILKDMANAKTVFWGLIISSAVLFVFQALRLFFPSALSLGVLGSSTDNMLGSWNAFGIFAGFVAIISLFIVEFFPLSKRNKWLLGILIALSVLLTATVNFPLIWGLLGVFAIIIFVYKISFSFGKKEDGMGTNNFPAFSFAIVMISLLFFISGQFIGGFLPNSLGLSNVEVRPSFSATMSVTKDAFLENPILGMGPNKFEEAWAMYKPEVINSTQFWDTSFNYGSGLLTTFTATVGILGIIAWITFFVLFIMMGLKSLFSSIKNNANWELALFFVASLYLFISSFFYSTGSVIFLLALALTGIFVGLSSRGIKKEEFSFSFLDDPRKSFFSILLLVVLMIVSASAGFKYVERLASISYFGKTLSASTIPIAEDNINQTLSLYQNDLYLRTYTQVYLTKINSIISKGPTTLSDQDKTDLQTSFNEAENGALSAIAYDNKNYLNYVLLGSVYNTVGALGVKDAYNKAEQAYETASSLNPLNPGIKLTIARIFLSDNDTKDARQFAKDALSLKPDYVDALVVSSQIEKADGNSALALSYGQQALSLAPTNKDLIQYVNSLKTASSSSSSTPSVTKKVK
jgi:tetratricopeptide (TPR) repeat protein